jgi:hypothetical protein
MMEDIENEDDELLDTTIECVDHPPSATGRKKNKKSSSDESVKMNLKNAVRENCTAKARKLINHAKNQFQGNTPVPETLQGIVFANIKQQCEHDPDLSTVISQVDRFYSKRVELINQNEIQVNLAAEQSSEINIFVNSIKGRSYDDLLIVESKVEKMMKAIALYKTKSCSDQIAIEYVMWAITKIANDKATPEARQFTTGEK